MTDLLKLEINGHFHWITKSSLAKHPNLKLGLLSANKTAVIQKYSKAFEHILDWLKFGKIQQSIVDKDVKQLKDLAKEINLLDLETMENEFEVIEGHEKPREDQPELEQPELKDVTVVETQIGKIPKSLLALSIFCSTIATLAFCINF